MGDELLPDLLVSGLRDDLPGQQIAFRAIWPLVNNLLRIGFPMPGRASNWTFVAVLMSSFSPLSAVVLAGLDGEAEVLACAVRIPTLLNTKVKTKIASLTIA